LFPSAGKISRLLHFFIALIALEYNQMYELHDNVTRNHRCQLGDFSGRILYALWNLVDWKGQLQEAFELTGINDDRDFGQWLTRVSEDEKFLHIHHVIMWIYQKKTVVSHL
jgi:hypothetical protein